MNEEAFKENVNKNIINFLYNSFHYMSKKDKKSIGRYYR